MPGRNYVEIVRHEHRNQRYTVWYHDPHRNREEQRRTWYFCATEDEAWAFIKKHRLLRECITRTRSCNGNCKPFGSCRLERGGE